MVCSVIAVIMSDSHVNSCHGASASCSCQSKLKEALRKYFGFSSFRPGQMKASLSVLHGQDVFVRMATGSGKSLCMFLGPLSKSEKAVGVIISPLNGLMEQQVCTGYKYYVGRLYYYYTGKTPSKCWYYCCSYQ